MGIKATKLLWFSLMFEGLIEFNITSYHSMNSGETIQCIVAIMLRYKMIRLAPINFLSNKLIPGSSIICLHHHLIIKLIYGTNSQRVDSYFNTKQCLLYSPLSSWGELVIGNIHVLGITWYYIFRNRIWGASIYIGYQDQKCLVVFQRPSMEQPFSVRQNGECQNFGHFIGQNYVFCFTLKMTIIF